MRELHLIDSVHRAAGRLPRFQFRHPPFPIELCVEQHLDGIRGQLDVMITVPDVCGREGRMLLTFEYPFRMPIDVHDFDVFVETAVRETFLHEMYETLRYDGLEVRRPHRPDGSLEPFTDVERYA